MPDREKVINDLQDAVNDDWMWQHADYYAKAMENAIALLKEQEAVVRCKDCKYCTEAADKKWRQDFEKSIYECNHMNLNFVEPDWFCADGEQKEGR